MSLFDTPMTDGQIADALQRAAAALAPNEPCKSWQVFIRWLDENGAAWIIDYGASDCDTAEEAIRQVVGYISDMRDWRINYVWAARQTDVTKFDGYRFPRAPQFQVR